MSIRSPLKQIPGDVVALADYEVLARDRMTPEAWAYLQGGAADEITLQDNLEAFRRFRLVPRPLEDVAGGHTRLKLFEDELDYPILLAPVAYHQLAHPEGELASVVAASAMKACMVVSTQAGFSLEHLAEHAQSPLWFQLYIQPDREFTLDLVRRVERAGYRALVLTVDAPVSGLRNREQRAGFRLPPSISAVNLLGMTAPVPQTAQAGESPLLGSPLVAAAPTWRDIEWLRQATTLPIVLKGVLSPDTARRALEVGVSGIAVSNHGGRTLDGAPATLDALPAIAKVVAKRIPLLLDGGVRRGTDVLKAIALGADAVMIGRPYVQALAAAGAPGVAHVLHILRAELELSMLQTGCRTLSDIDTGVFWRQEALLG